LCGDIKYHCNSEEFLIKLLLFCDHNLVNRIISSQAEELIKAEMVTMLHYDAVLTPTPAQLGIKDFTQKPKGPHPTRTLNEAAHLAYLEQHPYANVDEEDINAASFSCIKFPTILSN
jgi:hypothetical protein